MDLSFDPDSWWSYLLVFVAAATPVLEVLIVIPAAVLAGMHPIPVTLVALAGNLATMVAVIVGGDRLLGWWRDRRGGDRSAGSGRSDRARRVAQRWGVPALAFAAPALTGTHIAAVAALATGAERQRVLPWMVVGLVVWAGVTGVAAAFGVEVLR